MGGHSEHEACQKLRQGNDEAVSSRRNIAKSIDGGYCFQWIPSTSWG